MEELFLEEVDWEPFPEERLEELLPLEELFTEEAHPEEDLGRFLEPLGRPFLLPEEEERLEVTEDVTEGKVGKPEEDKESKEEIGEVVKGAKEETKDGRELH